MVFLFRERYGNIVATIPETILVILLLILVPFILFGYPVNWATIDHKTEENALLKDEICRLNSIIGELKENKRACWIPGVNINKPNLSMT